MSDAREVVRRVTERAEAAGLESTGYVLWLKSDDSGGLEEVASDLLESYDPERAAHMLHLLSMAAFIQNEIKWL